MFYIDMVLNTLNINNELIEEDLMEEKLEECDTKNNKYRLIWKSLKEGKQEILSYNEISELEDHIFNLSEKDNKLFNKSFKIFKDKRISCGISNRDYICSLHLINSEVTEKNNYIN